MLNCKILIAVLLSHTSCSKRCSLEPFPCWFRGKYLMNCYTMCCFLCYLCTVSQAVWDSSCLPSKSEKIHATLTCLLSYQNAQVVLAHEHQRTFLHISQFFWVFSDWVLKLYILKSRATCLSIIMSQLYIEIKALLIKEKQFKVDLFRLWPVSFVCNEIKRLLCGGKTDRICCSAETDGSCDSNCCI